MGNFKVLLSLFVICFTAREVYTRVAREAPIEEYGPITNYGKFGTGVYWREWRGVMPEDALIGANTTNPLGTTTPIYFAQAYMPQVKDAGLQPGQLFKHSTSVTVAHYGIFQITKPVKVLCGDPQAIGWVPVHEAGLSDPETDFVPAGFERGYETYYGRSLYNGKVYIGKVVWAERKMYFPLEAKEINLDSFDVLLYTRRH